jgi:hypothetical protein
VRLSATKMTSSGRRSKSGHSALGDVFGAEHEGAPVGHAAVGVAVEAGDAHGVLLGERR